MATAGTALIALITFLPPTAAGAQVVSGSTVDAETGADLGRVEVVLLDTLGKRQTTAVTDSAGLFTLELPAPGTYTLEASRLGYATAHSRRFELAYGESIDVEVRLGVRALTMDPLTISARRRDTSLRARDMREYYERMERYAETERRLGRILTREALENIPWTSTGELIEHHYQPLFPQVPSTFRTSSGPCTPEIYLDGQPSTLAMIRDLPVTGVEGIEFWPGFGAPGTRFTDAEHCGVLLVWRRPLEDNAHPFSLARLMAAIAAGVGLVLLVR